MKAEKFLNRLGLSVNIVVVILLLVIIYLLYCINDKLSIDLPVEYFNVGGAMSAAMRASLGLPPRSNPSTQSSPPSHSRRMSSRIRSMTQGQTPTDLSDLRTPEERETEQRSQAVVNAAHNQVQNYRHQREQNRAGLHCPVGKKMGPNGQCMTQEEIRAAIKETMEQGLGRQSKAGQPQPTNPGLRESNAAIRAGSTTNSGNATNGGGH
tara:strand:- start:4334 stop:4960 length:627 start_codon:yes stop_codon:yes gene_type:complete